MSLNAIKANHSKKLYGERHANMGTKLQNGASPKSMSAYVRIDIQHGGNAYAISANRVKPYVWGLRICIRGVLLNEYQFCAIMGSRTI